RGRQLAELGQVVVDLLLVLQQVRELREDAAGQRDVAGFHGDAGGSGERGDNRQQRLGGQERRFIGQRVDDLWRIRHGERALVSGLQGKGGTRGWPRATVPRGTCHGR